MRAPTILAMGGGGFTMEPENPALDDLVVALAREGREARARSETRARSEGREGRAAGAREPRILFLPTASGDPDAQIAAFHRRFHDRPCVAEHLSLFRRHGNPRPLADVVLEQDAVYVGGGSMRNLLAIWRAHALDGVLLGAWRRGVVLAGLSAGAMCWFRGGVTRSGGPPEPIAGLGLLPGSLTVHADGEPERLPIWLEAVRTGALPGGWAADDGVGLLFRGRTLDRVVTSRPDARAERADLVDGRLVRVPIDPELLPREPPSADDSALSELREHHRHRLVGGS